MPRRCETPPSLLEKGRGKWGTLSVARCVRTLERAAAVHLVRKMPAASRDQWWAVNPRNGLRCCSAWASWASSWASCCWWPAPPPDGCCQTTLPRPTFSGTKVERSVSGDRFRAKFLWVRDSLCVREWDFCFIKTGLIDGDLCVGFTIQITSGVKGPFWLNDKHGRSHFSIHRVHALIHTCS